MHCCATLTYPPSFVFLVTVVKVVTQHSPSLMHWMSSATSASPDEARKEWRRGGMMFLFHGARFRTGRSFLTCYFIIFFHVLSSNSNLLEWPKHVFSFLPRKGIEKGMDNIHSDVRIDILSLIVWTQIGSILHSRPPKAANKSPSSSVFPFPDYAEDLRRWYGF